MRERLGLSQEGLSRLLNATKAAVQHWERGRNNPDLARLLALRQLAPPGAERKALEGLIRASEQQANPLSPAGSRGHAAALAPSDGGAMLKRENDYLRRHVEKLEAELERREHQVRILESLVKELERKLSTARGRTSAAGSV